jgi:hypothetical protein
MRQPLDIAPRRRNNIAMFSLRHQTHDARRYFVRAIPLVAALVLGVTALATSSRADLASGPHASQNAAQPMRFVRVRSDAEACRPDCPEWISAEGKIVTGSADALERTLNAIGNRRLPIVINSAGGSVRDAMDMGRLIRAKRLAVVVAHTTFAHCPLGAASCGIARGVADSRDAYCASACTLVLAAGVERYVSPLSYVGVHQMTEVVKQTQVKRIYKVHYLQVAGLKLELSRHQIGEERSVSTAKLAADDEVDDEVSDYFLRMGVAEPVMKLTLATPSKGIHWLTSDEMKTSRLATAWLNGPKPFVDAAQPSGLDGLAVEPGMEPSAGSTSQFSAKLAAPLSAPIGERRATLEVTFAFRRGGGAVTTSFAVHDAQTGAPLALPGAGAYLIFYPQGAEYRTGRLAADAAARVGAPLRKFCRLQDGGRAVLSFIADAAAPQAPHPAPVVFTPFAAEGGAALFDEACPPRATAGSAIASAGGVSDRTAQ